MNCCTGCGGRQAIARLKDQPAKSEAMHTVYSASRGLGQVGHGVAKTGQGAKWVTGCRETVERLEHYNSTHGTVAARCAEQCGSLQVLGLHESAADIEAAGLGPPRTLPLAQCPRCWRRCTSRTGALHWQTYVHCLGSSSKRFSRRPQGNVVCATRLPCHYLIIKCSAAAIYVGLWIVATPRMQQSFSRPSTRISTCRIRTLSHPDPDHVPRYLRRAPPIPHCRPRLPQKQIETLLIWPRLGTMMNDP